MVLKKKTHLTVRYLDVRTLASHSNKLLIAWCKGDSCKEWCCVDGMSHVVSTKMPATGLDSGWQIITGEWQHHKVSGLDGMCRQSKKAKENNPHHIQEELLIQNLGWGEVQKFAPGSLPNSLQQCSGPGSNQVCSTVPLYI